MGIAAEKFNIEEFKTALEEFRVFLISDIDEDQDCDNEADELLEIIEKLQSELEDVVDEEEFFKTKFQKLLPDIVFVLECIEKVCAED